MVKRPWKNHSYSKSYRAIHKWLCRNYGKAYKCESLGCLEESKRYEWALIKGKEHDHNRENYISLCKSCHGLYDITKETIEKVRRKNWKAVQQKDVNNNLICEWPSIVSASKEFRIDPSSISKVIKGKRLLAGGFKWNLA